MVSRALLRLSSLVVRLQAKLSLRVLEWNLVRASFLYYSAISLVSLSLVSFTGSERVGRIVGQNVASRFGKVILELGGNNGVFYYSPSIVKSIGYHRLLLASIIMPDADLSLAVPAVFFGAVGTAGQRCTSTRRLYLHRQIADEFLGRLKSMYATVAVGDPLDKRTLLGPLHTGTACDTYTQAIDRLRSLDADIITGGARYQDAVLSNGNFVQPTIALPKSLNPKDDLWSTEIFAPILNVAIFDELEQAIEWNNAVPQGLSSSLWTRDIRSVGRWIGPAGSDAGIVNVGVVIRGLQHAV